MRQDNALSRLIGSQGKSEEDTLMVAIETETEVRRVFEDAIDGLPLIFTTINGATEDNEIVREVRDYFPTTWPNHRFQ